jgi:hypothetical protein
LAIAEAGLPRCHARSEPRASLLFDKSNKQRLRRTRLKSGVNNEFAPATRRTFQKNKILKTK